MQGRCASDLERGPDDFGKYKIFGPAADYRSSYKAFGVNAANRVAPALEQPLPAWAAVKEPRHAVPSR